VYQGPDLKYNALGGDLWHVTKFTPHLGRDPVIASVLLVYLRLLSSRVQVAYCTRFTGPPVPVPNVTTLSPNSLPFLRLQMIKIKAAEQLFKFILALKCLNLKIYLPDLYSSIILYQASP
jgi:hypothetical protein